MRWPGPRFQPRFPLSRSRAHQNTICVGARGASGVAVEVGPRDHVQRLEPPMSAPRDESGVRIRHVRADQLGTLPIRELGNLVVA